jgi:hypothetical protein
MLKRFAPLLVAAVIGAGAYHALTHQVLHTNGWQRYLEPELINQLNDRDKACNGLITAGPVSIGANKTSCELFTKLSAEQTGVVQLAESPKPPTALAVLWVQQQSQPQSPLLATGSKADYSKLVNGLSGTNYGGSDCDTGRIRVPGRYKRVVCDSARRHGIEPALLAAQIRQESGFNPRARSSANAQGIAQIIPSTARAWRVNPWDPDQAIEAMAKNMASYRRTYQRQGHDADTSHRLALAAYNAGPGRVAEYHGVPPYRQTRDYVTSIWGSFKKAIKRKA